jgi:hypothetical protein
MYNPVCGSRVAYYVGLLMYHQRCVGITANMKWKTKKGNLRSSERASERNSSWPTCTPCLVSTTRQRMIRPQWHSSGGGQSWAGEKCIPHGYTWPCRLDVGFLNFERQLRLCLVSTDSTMGWVAGLLRDELLTIIIWKCTLAPDDWRFARVLKGFR